MGRRSRGRSTAGGRFRTRARRNWHKTAYPRRVSRPPSRSIRRARIRANAQQPLAHSARPPGVAPPALAAVREPCENLEGRRRQFAIRAIRAGPGQILAGWCGRAGGDRRNRTVSGASPVRSGAGRSRGSQANGARTRDQGPSSRGLERRVFPCCVWCRGWAERGARSSIAGSPAAL